MIPANKRLLSALSTLPILLTGLLVVPAAPAQSDSKTITGQAAFTDYSQEHPGVRRKITVADLPEPKEAESVDNGPTVVPRPDGAWPQAPAGFRVQLYAGSSTSDAKGPFTEPRLMRTAPNGDIFLADSHGDKIVVLRGVGADGKAQTISNLRYRPQSAFRHRLLSPRPQPAMDLRGQHQERRPLPL